jgi:hypothetical protein
MSALRPPENWGTFEVEPFADYHGRWQEVFGHLPPLVVETWIYRHWREFQQWLPLRPLEWRYEVRVLSSDEVMEIDHLGDWMKMIDLWGDDLFNGMHRKNTWLGRFMLEAGTTPAPVIVALNAGAWAHPHEHLSPLMREPYQLIEGHMRLAYLRGMIRRDHFALKPVHEVFIATLPPNISFRATALGCA